MNDDLETMDGLCAALEEARQLVIQANNSLYGSQGYFHSMNGGPFNRNHLAEGIENLKKLGRDYYSRIEALEKALRDALISKDQRKLDASVTAEQAAEYVRKERERNANRNKPYPVSNDWTINDYD